MAEVRVSTTGTLKLFDADDSHSAGIAAGTITADATWKLIYDVLIYADADKRADRLEQTYRIKNRHVDHFKVDYSLDAIDNPFKLAYADLKTKDTLSNVKNA